jgi:hypothetical protein
MAMRVNGCGHQVGKSAGTLRSMFLLSYNRDARGLARCIECAETTRAKAMHSVPSLRGLCQWRGCCSGRLPAAACRHSHCCPEPPLIGRTVGQGEADALPKRLRQSQPKWIVSPEIERPGSWFLSPCPAIGRFHSAGLAHTGRSPSRHTVRRGAPGMQGAGGPGRTRTSAHSGPHSQSSLRCHSMITAPIF